MKIIVVISYAQSGGEQLKNDSVRKQTTPFDTIESALEFLQLLQIESTKARQEVEFLMEQDTATSPRREEAFRLVVYKLSQLNSHVESSQRVLHDLRALRTLLLREVNQ
ncbi:MAG: hypothetical protein JOZ45_16250 [Acidobacteriaceae bacterium]|nr:hypothetical protein [Acidobacteriaceae bacterium]MBV9307699.1 hypothetical protein [Acidobacteriaceae bacterium]